MEDTKLPDQIKDYLEHLSPKQKECLFKYDIANLKDTIEIVIRLNRHN